MLLICTSLSLIVLVTLGSFPSDGSASVHHSPRPIWLLGWGAQRKSEGVKASAVAALLNRDVLLNVVLFMPFGMSLTRWLTSRLPGLRSLVVVFGTCCAVSYTIEVLQQFLPGRFPALRDVLANSGGGVLGWVGFHGSRWLWWRLRRKSRTDWVG